MNTVRQGHDTELRRLDFDESEIYIYAAGDWRGFRSGACAKEPETAAWIRRVARPGTVFFDIGACVGSYSLIAAALGATVHAFEPSALNYAQLQLNAWLNRSDRLTAWPVALTSTATSLRIRLSSLAPGAASHEVTGHETHGAASPGQAAVGMPLDELISRFSLPSPTDIKIDVDGGELDVLEGARETLRRTRSVMIETSNQTALSASAILQAAGLEETGSWPRSGGQTNHLFERRLIVKT